MKSSLKSCIFCSRVVRKSALDSINQANNIKNYEELMKNLSSSICELFEVSEWYSCFFIEASLCQKCFHLVLNADFALRSIRTLEKQITHARRVLKEGFKANYGKARDKQQSKSIGDKLLDELKSSSINFRKSDGDNSRDEIIIPHNLQNEEHKIKHTRSGRKITKSKYFLDYEDDNSNLKTRKNSSKIQDCEIDDNQTDYEDYYIESNFNEPEADGDVLLDVKTEIISEEETKNGDTSNLNSSPEIFSQFNKIKSSTSRKRSSNNSNDSTKVKKRRGSYNTTRKKNANKSNKESRSKTSKRIKKYELETEKEDDPKFCCNISEDCLKKGKCFANSYLIKNHLREVHSKESLDNPYHCLLCEERFRKIPSLQAHEYKSHGIAMACPKCGKEFYKKCSLDAHMIRIHELKRDLPKCSICSKLFEAVEEVRIHEALHGKNFETLESSFNCVLCETGHFTTVSELRKHVVVSHETDTFKCSECPEIFVTQFSFYNHKRTHMVPRKEFKCSECPRKFDKNSYLIRHMYSHSSEPTFSCTYEGCDKKYFSKSPLSFHIKRHHIGGGEKFKCYLCPRKFFTRNCLKNHEPFHFEARPYLCDKCSSSFKTINNLRKHAKLHKVKTIDLDKSKGRKSFLIFDSTETIAKLSAKSSQVLENENQVEETYIVPEFAQ